MLALALRRQEIVPNRRLCPAVRALWAGFTGPGTEEKLDTINGLLSGKPVFDADLADPFVLDQGDVAPAYATNTRDANIPVVRVQG